MKPRLLDLGCKAGGSTKGYQLAGFHVTGLDIEDQPNYCGDAFIRGDMLTVSFDGFDAVHAGPPCQRDLAGLARVNQRLGRRYKHESITARVRARLIAWGGPWVLEQPEQGGHHGMHDPVRCCGTAFGLPVRRHRMFESNVPLVGVRCAHHRFTEKRYWTSWVKNGERQRATVVQVYGNGGERHEWPAALDIGWMTDDELTQAIPPAYTEHIGRQLLAALTARQVAA